MAFSGGTSSPATLILPAALWLAGGGGSRGARPDASARKLVKRKKTKIEERKRNAHVCTHSATERARFMKLGPSL